MRTIGWTLLFAAACDNDSGFSQNNDDNVDEQGTGVAEFLPTELVYEDCEPGIANGKPFKITNVGENTLTVYEISVISGGLVFFVEDVDSFGLEPKEDREFQVVATLEPPMAPADGVLRIKTSDPDAQDFQMPLHAEPAPKDTGGSDDTGK